MKSNFFGHIRTVIRHRHAVFKNCCRAGIPWRGLWHDLSKFSPSEFIPSVKHYAAGRRSPNELERADYGYSLAWMHHKGRNRHHFEYWTDYDPETHELTPVRMPDKYLVEMFCDRVGASKVYKGSEYTDAAPYEYYMRGMARRKLHPETAGQIELLLTMLKDKGEDETFGYIRKVLLRRGERSR